MRARRGLGGIDGVDVSQHVDAGFHHHPLPLRPGVFQPALNRIRRGVGTRFVADTLHHEEGLPEVCAGGGRGSHDPEYRHRSLPSHRVNHPPLAVQIVLAAQRVPARLDPGGQLGPSVPAGLDRLAVGAKRLARESRGLGSGRSSTLIWETSPRVLASHRFNPLRLVASSV